MSTAPTMKDWRDIARKAALSMPICDFGSAIVIGHVAELLSDAYWLGRKSKEEPDGLEGRGA